MIQQITHKKENIKNVNEFKQTEKPKDNNKNINKTAKKYKNMQLHKKNDQTLKNEKQNNNKNKNYQLKYSKINLRAITNQKSNISPPNMIIQNKIHKETNKKTNKFTNNKNNINSNQTIKNNTIIKIEPKQIKTTNISKSLKYGKNRSSYHNISKLKSKNFIIDIKTNQYDLSNTSNIAYFFFKKLN
jgi:hypothetical protein